MKQGRIHVEVAPGVFSSERSVSFEAAGTKYNLIVDESDIDRDMLKVSIIGESEKEAIVDTSPRCARGRA